MADLQKRCGSAAIAGALLAIVGDAVVLAATPAAADDRPLALGLFQLLVTTPVALSAGFASAAAFTVIAIADLLTAGIGLALIREPAAVESLAAAPSP